MGLISAGSILSAFFTRFEEQDSASALLPVFHREINLARHLLTVSPQFRTVSGPFRRLSRHRPDTDGRPGRPRLRHRTPEESEYEICCYLRRSGVSCPRNVDRTDTGTRTSRIGCRDRRGIIDRFRGLEAKNDLI